MRREPACSASVYFQIRVDLLGGQGARSREDSRDTACISRRSGLILVVVSKHDYRTTMSSGVPGLRPLAQLFGLGLFLLVGAVIAFGAIEALSVEALKRLQPLIERGELAAGQVLKSTTAKPAVYTVEYQLDFEDEVRRAVIYGTPGVADDGRYRVEPDGPPQSVSLLFDPLNPGDVVFADTLDAQVDAALAHLQPWKPRAWFALFGGLLLSAFTFLPMKRLANKHAVPLVHYHDDDTYTPMRPSEYGKYAGIVATIGGLLTITVCAIIYVGNSRIEQLATRGVPIRGEIVESFVVPDDDDGPHRFKVRYAMSPSAPPMERTIEILKGIRAQRFEVEEGQTREVALVVDPETPSRVRLELPMQWELARARSAKWVALVTLAICTLITIAAVLLFLRCRRILIDDPTVVPRRRRRR